MITMMRRRLGKVSHHPAIAIGIGHTIRKALFLSSPFDFSTSSGGSGGGGTVVGRGRGTVSESEEINKLKTPRKAPIDDQSGSSLPPSNLLRSVVSSGAAGGGGKQPTVGKDKVQEELNKPEAVMVCIDNSLCMKYLEPYRYRLQINCIRSYSRAKLQSNPKNSIGILTMSTFEFKNNLFPTSDLDEILHNLKYQLDLAGALDFKQGIKDAWWHLPSNEQSKKRMLFFIGGPINLNIKKAKAAGKWLQQRGVAVDVVNFWRKGRFTLSKRALDAFVAAVNNDNNSHIQHVQVQPSTHFKDVLLRAFNLDEGEIARIKKAKDDEKERVRKNELKLMLQRLDDKLVKERTMGNGRW